jgi:phage repressor protein C with HTH and peptisase S24 domain
MVDDTPQEALRELARLRGVSFAGLSRMLGRNAAYVQQFVERGTPRRLTDRDRRILSQFFGVEESRLGGLPSTGSVGFIRRLNVSASAGPGALVESEQTAAEYGFDRRWLRDISSSSPDDLSIIRVDGSSMEPTLLDGDDILVDRSDEAPHMRDGIYVLRRDQTLMVKRLSLHPTAGTLTIGSDNPAYSTWTDCDPKSVDIVGRVIWAGRRLR